MALLHTVDWTKLRALYDIWQTERRPVYLPPPGDRIDTLRQALPDLLAFLEHHDQPWVDHMRQELPLALTLLLLMPEQAVPPPAAVWQPLVQLCAEEGAGAEWEQCLEIGIAWGCGWQRTIQPDSRGWEGEWSNAVLVLCSMVLGSVRESVRQLVELLAGKTCAYQFATILRQSEHTRQIADILEQAGTGALLAAHGELASYASQITMELILTVCACGNHRRQCSQDARSDHADGQPGRQAQANSCGRECCLAHHQLASWQPGEHMLRAFVAEAVRGSAAPKLQTGAYARSMLYPRLAEDFGILVDRVEFKICPTVACNAALLQQTLTSKHQLEISRVERGLYEGNLCPDCATPASPRYTYYLARRNWLLIPYLYGGVYEHYVRWSCTSCGNLLAAPACQDVYSQIDLLKRQLAMLDDTSLHDPVLQQFQAYTNQPLTTHTLRKQLRAHLKELEQHLKALKKGIRCPLCNGELSQRITHVWVYAP